MIIQPFKTLVLMTCFNLLAFDIHAARSMPLITPDDRIEGRIEYLDRAQTAQKFPLEHALKKLPPLLKTYKDEALKLLSNAIKELEEFDRLSVPAYVYLKNTSDKSIYVNKNRYLQVAGNPHAPISIFDTSSLIEVLKWANALASMDSFINISGLTITALVGYALIFVTRGFWCHHGPIVRTNLPSFQYALLDFNIHFEGHYAFKGITAISAIAWDTWLLSTIKKRALYKQLVTTNDALNFETPVLINLETNKEEILESSHIYEIPPGHMLKDIVYIKSTEQVDRTFLYQNRLKTLMYVMENGKSD